MRLLIVDDDTSFAATLASAFRRRGYDIAVAHDAHDAIAKSETFRPERALVDLRMAADSGLTVVRALAEKTAVVVLTGYGSIPTAIAAIKLGAVHYLTKPCEPDEILAAFAGRAPSANIAAPTLDEAKRVHLERVLSESGGNVSEAARRLKLHRRSLQRMLQKK